jgi:hypothetical protein
VRWTGAPTPSPTAGMAPNTAFADSRCRPSELFQSLSSPPQVK